MFKKITENNLANITSLKAGDKIMLYGIPENGMTVYKKYFELIDRPTFSSPSYFSIECYLIREDGTKIHDKWAYGGKTINLSSYTNLPYVCGSYGTSIMRFYFDPKTPCEMVINNLKQAKRNLNKKIVDCQRYMFQVKEEDA